MARYSVRTMRFRELSLSGANVIELEPIGDERGFFSRAFARTEFTERGLVADVVHCNLSYNRRRGTLRGFHYQVPPAAEAKLVRCIRGAVHNVIVDMRPNSPTYLRHEAVELSAANRLALYVPPQFATGMQTLADETELYYQVSAPYTPEAERGLRYDDPLLDVDWPLRVTELSPKDAAWPLLAADSP